MLSRICLMAAMAVPAAPTVFAAEPVDFALRIRPVFVQHCGDCHGDAKQMGKLELTSVAGIQAKLTAEPELLVAGKPDESELFQRLVLPENHRKRMPKQAAPLAAETIAIIRAWIEQGAKLGSATPVTDTPASPAANQQALPEVPPAATEAIAELKAGGAFVMPLHHDSPLLDVSYALRDEPAGDSELELLESVAEQLVSLNLKGIQASEVGYASLAKFPNLRRLHLEMSSITDSGLQHVAKLDSLEYLNLYGTVVSDAGLRYLRDLPHLRSLYLWRTHVSYDAAMELAGQIHQLDVNLGHDHPVIVKQRLAAEIDSIGEQLTEIKVEEEAARRQLDSAGQRKAALQERLTELEASMKQLAEPSGESVHPADAAPDEPTK